MTRMFLSLVPMVYGELQNVHLEGSGWCVACQAHKAGIHFTKEGNCFTHISDAAGLARIADTLSEPQTIGRLSQICERRIYTTCLCFALELEEQKQSGFRRWGELRSNNCIVDF